MSYHKTFFLPVVILSFFLFPLFSHSQTFTTNLTVGSRGAEVQALQEFLKTQGHFTGTTTDFFGPLTRAALARWQAANNISPAVGYFGPLSRQRASTGATTTTTPPPTTVTTPTASTSTFTQNLTLGSRGAEVVKLQNFLKSQGHFTGTTTDYFGPLTKNALTNWQRAQNITPASGFFGPLSRQKAGGSTTTTTTTTQQPTSSPTINYPNLLSPVSNFTNSLVNIVTSSGCAPGARYSTTTGKLCTTTTTTTSTTTTRPTSGGGGGSTRPAPTNTTSTGGGGGGGGGGGAPAPSPTPPPPATPAPIVSLISTNPSISSGQSTNITWSSTDATSCSGTGGWSGSRSTSGTISVSPTSTTVYTLTCTGAGGSATQSITLTVTQPQALPAPGITFSASPSSIISGQSTTLTWSTTDATSCSGTGGWSGSRATSGAVSVSPTLNTTYTLTCTGAGGNATQVTIVDVSLPPPPPASTKFSLNDRVQVSSTSLNVRATANGTLLGTQANNALGTVIGGPTNAGGFDWWNINFDSGVDGWSAEDFLNAYTVSPPPPPNLSSSGVGTALFVDNFESGNLGDSGRWQDIVGGSGFNMVSASAEGISAPLGGRVLKINGTAGVITHFITPRDHAYTSFWAYFTNNTGALRYGMFRGSRTQWGSFGIGGICPQDAVSLGREEFFSNSLINFSGSPTFQLYNYWLGMLPYANGQCFGRTAQAGTGSPVATYHDASFVPSAGTWHLIERELHLNTAGSADGWEKVWVDGNLKIEHNNVTYRTDSQTKIQAISHDFNTPGQTMYMDNVELYASRAGSPTSSPTPPPPPPPPTTATINVITNVVNTGGGTATPANFSITISGASANATPSSFSGSTGGTVVTVNGGATYAVNPSTVTNYSASLSTNCSGSISAGSSATCIVTETYNPPASPPTPPPPPASTVAFIQDTSAGSTSGSSVSSNSLNVTSGNLIVVITHNTSGVTPTVSDSQGNTYQLDRTLDPADPGRQLRVYSAIASTTGSNVVTVSTSTAQRIGVIVKEFSGVDTSSSRVNQASSATGTGVAASSGNVALTGNGVIVGSVACAGTCAATLGSTFANLEESVAGRLASQDRIVSGGTTDSADFTVATGSWGAIAIAYKGASGATVSPTPPPATPPPATPPPATPPPATPPPGPTPPPPPPIVGGGTCEATGGGVCYYIDPVNGSDSNTGLSPSQAFLKPQTAVQRATPGSVIYLRGGTYGSNHMVPMSIWGNSNNGFINIANGTGSANYSPSPQSGTASNPITIKAYPGENPILQNTIPAKGSPTAVSINITNRNYWVIDGLELSHGAINICGVRYPCGSTHDITFRNNDIHDVIAQPGNGGMIFFIGNPGTAYNIFIENNDIHDMYATCDATCASSTYAITWDLDRDPGHHGAVAEESCETYNQRRDGSGNLLPSTCGGNGLMVVRNNNIYNVPMSFFLKNEMKGPIVIQGNTFYNQQKVLNAIPSNVLFEGNVVDTSPTASRTLGFFGRDPGWPLPGGTSEIVRYNTLVGTDAVASFNNDGSNHTIERNVVFGLTGRTTSNSVTSAYITRWHSLGSTPGYDTPDIAQSDLRDRTVVNDNCLVSPHTDFLGLKRRVLNVGGTQVTEFYNISQIQSILGFDTRSTIAVGSNPSAVFVNPSALDYRLASGGPCTGRNVGHQAWPGVVNDSSAPVLSGGTSSATLAASGTTTLAPSRTTISVNTNEPAYCRYSNTPGTDYNSMIQGFRHTGGISHSVPLYEISSGQSYTYYVRCMNTGLTYNTSDYPITFTAN